MFVFAGLSALGRAEAGGSEPAGDTVRVAGIILKWVEGNRPANYRRAERLIRRAAANGAKIVATPESFLDGYSARNPNLSAEQFRALAEPIPDGSYFQRLRSLADELDIYLIAAITELEGQDVYNSAAFLGPDGALLGTYRKKFLWPGEAHLYKSGNKLLAFETPYGKVGIMICYDRMQPAAIEQLVDEGADVVFAPAGGSWGSESDSIMGQRSREGGIPIVFVHPIEFLVTGPDGSVLTTVLHGDKLDDPDSNDDGTVAYFDLPLCRMGAD